MAWKSQQASWDVKRLVFIDETGLNTKMARHYGWALHDQRCLSKVPHGHWHTSSFIAALRHDKITAPFLIEGAVDADVFTTYLKTTLCPELKEGDTVILDNLSTHKIQNVSKLIEAQGAEVRYLPAYSPDLNPIEMAFSKLKAHLRQAAARTYLQLLHALRDALKRFDASHCSNFFHHANYATN